MNYNSNDVAPESVVEFFKEEVRDIDEILFENDLRDLVCLQFGFGEDVYVRLMECGLDVESLLLIKEDDLKEIFPRNMLGTRIKFRSRVFQWQQKIGVQKIAQSIRAPRTVPISSTFTTNIPSPSRIASISSPPGINFDQSSLHTMLQSSPKGQTILKFFEEHSKLLDDHRIALVSLIVDFYKDRSLAMTMSDIVRCTEEIGILFPSEEKRYYYSTRGKGLNPKGKLYDKAINARRKIKKVNTYGQVAVTNNKTSSTEWGQYVANNEDLERKHWLSQNMKPWEDVLRMWKLTFKLRRSEILKREDIFKNWPLFKNPMGYSLIEIDFAELFPESAVGISDEWKLFREVIVPHLKERIKDPDSKELMERINDDIPQDSRDCIILMLLHAIIKPPLLSTKLLSSDGGNKRRKWKPSISDAQNATIMHCTTMDDFQKKFERLKSEATQKNKVIQPQLMVIGEDLTKLESFYVLYDCILYKINSFVKSLDILVKLYYVMNLDFRLEAKYVYEFIESHFLRIKLSSNPNIISLSNYLNNCKSM